jgi:hypothetical protein
MVWKERLKDQCTKTAEAEAKQKLLLETLENNTRVKEQVVLTLQAMQVEARASSEKILQSVQGMTVALAERAAAAAESAAHAKADAEAARQAAEDAAAAARAAARKKVAKA